ncbi:MAG: hypothetical protein ABWY78_06210 [Microvirga sp.]
MFTALALAGVAVAILGMAGANTQVIGGVLKTVYEDFVAEATNNKFPLKELYKWETAEYAGQEVVYTAHVTRNVSPMWVGEDSAFADAGSQGYVKVHIGQRKLMARVRMTSEAIHDSMKTEGAFKSARKDEMNRLIDDISRMEEYSCTADGRGVLSLIDDASPTGSTTLLVDAPGGVTGDDFGNRFFLPGMYVIAVNPATGELRTQARKVVSCSSDGTGIVLDAVCDASWADNDYLVQAANSSVSSILDTSYENAAWGLTGLFDDGTYRTNYFNVDRNLYPQYQSYVKAATTTISEDLFQQTADVVDQRLGGEVSLMTAHHSIRRLVIQLTQADRRYTGGNLMKPDAGTTAFTMNDIPFGGVPIKAIRSHPLAMLFGIDKAGSGFVRYASEKGKWVDEDGSVLVRVGSGSTGRDSFEAWYRKRYQNHARYPGKNFRLDGITGQSLIVVREAGS